MPYVWFASTSTSASVVGSMTSATTLPRPAISYSRSRSASWGRSGASKGCVFSLTYARIVSGSGSPCSISFVVCDRLYSRCWVRSRRSPLRG